MEAEPAGKIESCGQERLVLGCGGMAWHGMAWFIREQGPRKGQSVLPAGRGGMGVGVGVCVCVRSTEYGASY